MNAMSISVAAKVTTRSSTHDVAVPLECCWSSCTDITRVAEDDRIACSAAFIVPKGLLPTTLKRGGTRGRAVRARGPWTEPTRATCEPSVHVAETRVEWTRADVFSYSDPPSV